MKKQLSKKEIKKANGGYVRHALDYVAAALEYKQYLVEGKKIMAEKMLENFSEQEKTHIRSLAKLEQKEMIKRILGK